MAAENTDALLEFGAQLEFGQLPKQVVTRTKDLVLDWFGSVLAGRNAHTTRIMEEWAAKMGPESGGAQCLTRGQRTSPLFAAMVNGASSHVVEQDDVHNGAVVHPAATVIPAALAAAQDHRVSGADLITAIVTGYEVAIRVGRFLGPSHYKVFHTSGTAGTLGAAAAVGKILGLSREKLRDCLGSAGTQAAGLWEFLRDAADSKQLHIAKAGADGLLAAYGAQWGLKGARQILEGSQGMGAGLSSAVYPKALSENLGESWGVMETSLKWHASCRHTHPAADALADVMKQYSLTGEEIASVDAGVHQAAVDVLTPAEGAVTIHQSKFSMPFVLALIAISGHASLTDFTEENLHDFRIREFMKRVRMVVDPEVEAAYPERWLGRVKVLTQSGRKLEGRIDVPVGDPDNFLPHSVIVEKVGRLAAFGGLAATEEPFRHTVSFLENLEQWPLIDALPLFA